MPKVETVLVPSYDFWGGVGEPTICVVTLTLSFVNRDPEERFRCKIIRSQGTPARTWYRGHHID